MLATLVPGEVDILVGKRPHLAGLRLMTVISYGLIFLKFVSDELKFISDEVTFPSQSR